MNDSIKSIVDKIIERHSAFNPTDDYPVDRDFIVSMCDDVRESLIRDSYKKLGIIDSKFYVRSCCHEIVCHSDDCQIDGLTVSSGLSHFKVELPETVSGINEQDLIRVGDAYGIVNFTKKNWGSYVNSEHSLWLKNKPIYTRFSGFILVKNIPTDGMKFVCIDYIPKHPTTICNYNDDMSYPVPSTNSLIEMVLEKLIESGIGQKDIYNDGDDGITNPKANMAMLKRMKQMNNAQQQQE